jgi:PKD repeat protein
MFAICGLLPLAACTQGTSTAALAEPGYDIDPTATPSEGPFPLTVTFHHGASSDLEPGAYTWTFGDGSASTPGLAPQHTYDAPGMYTATVSITDPLGNERTASVDVTVTEIPPNAAFTFANPPDAWPTTAAPRTVTFDGRASSDDVGVVSYEWAFIGTTLRETGPSVTRTFASPGTYEVQLTVWDGDGQSDTLTKEVTVTQPPEPDPESVRIRQSGLQSSYPPGATASGTITIEIDDPDHTLRHAVPFINVVEAQPPYPQAAGAIASSAVAEPDIFQTVYERDALEAGLTTTVTFELRQDAPKGDYDVVIQLFAGTNTNSYRVDVDDRFAMQAFPVRIE